jgi:hypothetical protein
VKSQHSKAVVGPRACKLQLVLGTAGEGFAAAALECRGSESENLSPDPCLKYHLIKILTLNGWANIVIMDLFLLHFGTLIRSNDTEDGVQFGASCSKTETNVSTCSETLAFYYLKIILKLLKY